MDYEKRLEDAKAEIRQIEYGIRKIENEFLIRSCESEVTWVYKVDERIKGKLIEIDVRRRVVSIMTNMLMKKSYTFTEFFDQYELLKV